MGILPYEKVKRSVHVKQEAETDANHGCEPLKRKIEELMELGIVNVNKPSGPTSHQTSAYVQEILSIKKSGHSGTLDPHVTGVLPVGLERGTRIVQFLLKLGKEYVCLMNLHKEMSEMDVKKAMEKLVGKMNQLPPVKSAVKRVMRQREIYFIEVLEVNKRDVLFRIGSEAGFYVRKFCHDFGKVSGAGAHMVALVRTRVGPFTDKNWFSLGEVKDAYEFYKQGDETKIREVIKPIEFSIDFMPKIWIMDSAIDSICHGANLNIPGVCKFESFTKNENVSVLSLKGELVCVGKAEMGSEEMLKKDKGLIVNSSKVFMKTNVYPKFSPKVL